MAAAAAGAARSAARAVANDVSASVSNGAAAPADSAAAELGALRSRVAELEGDRQRLLDAPPTIESLATSIEMLVAGQAQLVAGQSKVEEMMLQSMGKDASGHRAAPTESLELASTIKAMEEHGLTTFQVDQAHTMFELYDLDGSGCLDPAELLEILRALGTHPTKERVAELIREEDRSENGTVTLNEFFHVYEKLAVPLDGVTVDGVHDTQGLNLKAISDYGIYAMMRWVHHDDDEINGDVTGPLVPVFRRKCRSFVLRRDAEYIFYIAIWLSAVSSGLNTYDEFVQLTWVEGLADVTMIIFGKKTHLLRHFTLKRIILPRQARDKHRENSKKRCVFLTAFEVFVKFMCETQSCGAVLGFFGNFWNGFDFFLLVSIGVMTPLLKDQDGPTALRCLRILRLVRSLRILRAAKILPKLMLVLETLIASITSVGYIVLFMLLTSYIFAIVAVTLFGKNDPFHFGDLGSAMLSLFRIATQEDWTDIMYFNMYGCDGWGDYSGAVAVGSDDCVPESFFFASPAFFVLCVHERCACVRMRVRVLCVCLLPCVCVCI